MVISDGAPSEKTPNSKFLKDYRPKHPTLWQSLRLAINKIIHDDDIQVRYFQDAIARGNSDQKNASCVKPDSQERKASAMRGSGQYVPA